MASAEGIADLDPLRAARMLQYAFDYKMDAFEVDDARMLVERAWQLLGATSRRCGGGVDRARRSAADGAPRARAVELAHQAVEAMGANAAHATTSSTPVGRQGAGLR